MDEPIIEQTESTIEVPVCPICRGDALIFGGICAKCRYTVDERDPVSTWRNPGSDWKFVVYESNYQHNDRSYYDVLFYDAEGWHVGGVYAIGLPMWRVSGVNDQYSDDELAARTAIESSTYSPRATGAWDKEELEEFGKREWHRLSQHTMGGGVFTLTPEAEAKGDTGDVNLEYDVDLECVDDVE